MTDLTWAALRQLLVDRYDEFRTRLSRQLGSEDLASESLHETYLRLNRDDTPGAVRSPAAYLLKTALNIAMDTYRSDARRLKRFEIAEILEIPDEAPGPARDAEARLRLKHLERIVAELPWRQRSILISARFKEIPHRQIAERLGISVRMVQLELKAALEYCEERLEEK